MQKFSTPSVNFDHYGPEYKCCCSSIHVLQGTQIIGVLQVVLAIFSCVVLVFATELDPLWSSIEVISLIIEIGVLVALFFALKREESKLLLPYLVFEVLWIVGSIVIMLLAVVACINPKSEIGRFWRGQLIEITVNHDEQEKKLEDTVIRVSALFTVLSFAITTVVSIWWLHVVYKCYIYLKNYGKARDSSDTTMRYSQSQP